MANWCSNWVEINGDSKEVKRFVELVGKEFDFAKVIHTNTDSRDEATEKWGCGSIAFDVHYEDEKDIKRWEFVTRWNPPYHIYKKLVEMFPKVFIKWQYEEPGNGLYGYLNDGQGGF